MLTPQVTYVALLVVQAFHLLHHRLAIRHISFAEVISAVVLPKREGQAKTEQRDTLLGQ